MVLMMSRSKLVVLYIDFDNDMQLCGISTPVVGYESAISAAQRFAICRPTDSDLNAMYRAIQMYLRLKDKEDVEIAFVGGARGSTYEAFSNLIHELKLVKKETGADEAIVVFDSVEDEKTIPVIAQIFSIKAIEVVVVEQPKGLETFYRTIVKIVNKVKEDPKFAKLILGYPGVLLLMLSILSLLDLLHIAIQLIAATLALAMVVRGFELHKEIKRLRTYSTQTPSRVLTVVLTLAFLAIALYISITDYLSHPATAMNPIGVFLRRYSHYYLLPLTIPLISKVIHSAYHSSRYELVFTVTLVVDLLLGYVLLQNIASLLIGDVLAVYAIPNIVLITASMLTITALSEYVVRSYKKS